MGETIIHTSFDNQTRQTNVDLTQDPSSIYYLHPSDHASTKLVTAPFDGNAFGDWKRSIMIGLIAKNKLCFVDGTLPQPTTDAAHIKAWHRCNNMVIGWLISSLDRVVAKSVMYNKYASEIRTDLEERFGVSTSAQIYSLHEELSNISQEANMSITEYYTKVKLVWDEIGNLNPLPVCTCDGCSCGLTKKVLKLQQDQRLMSFLMNVDDQYGLVKTNILMLPELPNVSMAYSMLYQEQKHKEHARIHNSSSDSMAFMANKKYFSDKNHFNSRFSKQPNTDGSTLNKYKNSVGSKCHLTYFCDHYKISGHSIERRFKVHGYPPGFKHKRFASSVQDNDHKSELDNLGLAAT